MPGVQEAIALIKAGNRRAASRSWPIYWLRILRMKQPGCGCRASSERDDQRRYCLKQILKHNPNHALARSALAKPGRRRQLSNWAPRLGSRRRLVGSA